MFNLDKAVAAWRRQMFAAGVKSADVLDELETHLRDEIESQMRSGTDEENAFQVAISRLGEPLPLREEFAKLTKSIGRHRFLKICYLGFIPCMFLINLWTLLEYELSLAERIVGGAAISFIGLYLLRLPYLLDSLPSDAYLRMAKIIKLAVSLFWLWPMWALLEALHIVSSGMGIVPTMVVWSLYAAVMMTAIAFGINGSSRPPGRSGGLPPFPQRPIPIHPMPSFPTEFDSLLPQKQTLDAIVSSVLKAASEEAVRLGHDYIGTEHVLLATLQLTKGPFERVLQNVDLDRQAVQVAIEGSVSPVPAHMRNKSIVLTPRARKALLLAGKEAKKRHQSSIGAEHIFLGLLLEGHGIAAKVLRKLGIRVSRVRQASQRFRGLAQLPSALADGRDPGPISATRDIHGHR